MYNKHKNKTIKTIKTIKMIREIKKQFMIRTIKKEFPNENIHFIEDKKKGLFHITIQEKNIFVTFSKEKKVKDIIKYVNYLLQKDLPNECSICFTDNINKGRIFCIQCSGEICIFCYIQIFMKNQGVIYCPYCRISYGKNIEDPEKLYENIQHILNNIFRIIDQNNYIIKSNHNQIILAHNNEEETNIIQTNRDIQYVDRQEYYNYIIKKYFYYTFLIFYSFYFYNLYILGRYSKYFNLYYIIYCIVYCIVCHVV